jgi:hypothetical protein
MADTLGYLRCSVILAAASIASAAGNAQTPATVVRFTVFSAKPISDLAYVPRGNAAPQKLAFYSTARSPGYEYRGPMPLRFFGATSGELVAEANIPPEIRHALLLFLPVESEPVAGSPALRYRVAVLDDGASRHGPGGLAIINLSGLVLGGAIGKEKITLKAGLNPTLPVGRSAQITLSTVVKNRTYQSYAATITLDRNQRALLILFPPFYKGGLEVQSRLLLDQPPASAPVVR